MHAYLVIGGTVGVAHTVNVFRGVVWASAVKSSSKSIIGAAADWHLDLDEKNAFN